MKVNILVKKYRYWLVLIANVGDFIVHIISPGLWVHLRACIISDSFDQL